LNYIYDNNYKYKLIPSIHTLLGNCKTSSPYWSSRDDIYIDDDGNLEGSGGGQREVKDDLESSGSGFGPDDEDSFGSGGVEPPVTNQKSTVVETVEDKKLAPHESGPPSQPGGGQDVPVDTPVDDPDDVKSEGNDVYIMNPKPEESTTSFFAQPGILAVFSS
ncbi:hypothetical protein L9F63_005739, partial [Diploptera punctata]